MSRMTLHVIGQKTVQLTEADLEKVQELSRSIGYFQHEQEAAQAEVSGANRRVSASLWTLQYLRGQVQDILAKAAGYYPPPPSSPPAA